MLEYGQPTTASLCGSQACVQVTLLDQVLVKDTKPDGATFAVPVDSFRRFIAAVRAGELGPPTTG